MFSFGKSAFGHGKLNSLVQAKQSIITAKIEAAVQLKSALAHKPFAHQPKGRKDDDCDEDDDRFGGKLGGLKSHLAGKLSKIGGLLGKHHGHKPDDDDQCDNDKDDDKDDDKGGHHGGGHGGHHGGHHGGFLGGWFSGHHGSHGGHHGGHHGGGKDDDCDEDDDNAGGGNAGGIGSGVNIPKDTTGVTFHVDEDTDGQASAYIYIKAEDGVDPASVNFDDYLARLKENMAEDYPDLDPAETVIKATIYSASEGESFYYFNGTEFEQLEDGEYYEEFAGNFGVIPDEEPGRDNEDEDDDEDKEYDL